MGDVIDLHTPPARPEDNQDLVRDLCRFSEGLLSEAFIKKKYRFDAAMWEAFGGDDKLVEAVELEKIRRERDGSTKREKSQQLIVKAPAILDTIMSDPAASPRHRVDAIKTLDTFAANNPGNAAPATDRFQITINLSGDGVDHTLHFDKSISINPDDRDPFNDVDTDTDVTATPWGMFLANSKKDGGDNGGHL